MIKSKDVKSSWENVFSVGFFCACAEIMRQHGDDVITRDVLNVNFASIAKMREIGVDENDIEVLAPIIADIERRNQQ